MDLDGAGIGKNTTQHVIAMEELEGLRQVVGKAPVAVKALWRSQMLPQLPPQTPFQATIRSVAAEEVARSPDSLTASLFRVVQGQLEVAVAGSVVAMVIFAVAVEVVPALCRVFSPFKGTVTVCWRHLEVQVTFFIREVVWDQAPLLTALVEALLGVMVSLRSLHVAFVPRRVRSPQPYRAHHRQQSHSLRRRGRGAPH